MSLFEQDQQLSSRILVISTSKDQARDAAKLIQNLVHDDHDHDHSLLSTSTLNDNLIPWTIKNKYYSANVHFHLVELESGGVPLQVQVHVPAVIFVWTRGQPYAEHVFALQRRLSQLAPEVALAIALGKGPPHHDDPPEGPDSFLADHGFEYIDGERTQHSADVEHDDHTDNPQDEDVAPGLLRVIDALSTIMWPSMVREHDNGRRKSQAPTLLDFDVLRTEEGTLVSLMEADAAYHGAPLTRANRAQKEMAALERWLIENEELYEAEFDVSRVHVPGGDPWVSSHSTSSVAQHDGPTSGFDDDFSAFVSAPPAVSVNSAAAAATLTVTPTTSAPTTASTPGFATVQPAHTLLDALTLLPSHTGGSFRSLRSGTSGFISDVDDHMGYEALDDRSTSAPEREHEFGDDEDPRTPVSQRTHERAGLNEIPFDLTNILSVLQTMREDVAGIEDEAQRRATTARFASEFVFERLSDVDGDENKGTKD
ncbi:hypothetical protein B0F90DRAFT_1706129 [Multifurca ochricompacta]|uniref:Uncharacterized protein n=1 Tax=Multifurca ochricompacta TaxID=376703 RepID=A0AAD4QQD0_9AGAM|nr:hypothetical protein B0F90DRAFT_1706129 [Multifurca ochricompacta]